MVGYPIFSGDPHLVVELVPETFSEIDFIEAARPLRWWNGVSSAGSNVHFVARRPGEWLIRSYERGVEDETLACGSGCMAAARALTHPSSGSVLARFRTKGGDSISVHVSSGLWRVSGPARLVFTGSFYWPSEHVN
jgi:diaminopimelate epimerase